MLRRPLTEHAPYALFRPALPNPPQYPSSPEDPYPSGSALGRTQRLELLNAARRGPKLGNMAQQRLQIPLETVDSLTITTLVDNVFDVFMPDQGPAHRISPAAAGHRLP